MLRQAHQILDKLHSGRSLGSLYPSRESTPPPPPPQQAEHEANVASGEEKREDATKQDLDLNNLKILDLIRSDQ